MLKKEETGQIGVDFLVQLFVILVGFWVLLLMWTSIDTQVINTINNLEGDNDAAIVALLVLIPLAAAVNFIRFAFKGKSDGEIPRQPTGTY